MISPVAAIVSVGLFYVLVLVVGVMAGRRHPSGNAGGLIVAGRKMPLWIGVFTMTATWVGGGYINGTAEAAYTRGLVWAQAPWGYALSLVVDGLVFAGVMRRAGYTTLLDPFQQRYGRTVTAALFLPALIGEVFWSAAILAALGATFSVMFEFDLSTSIIVSAAIAIGYTVIGGLWSVAYTDVVQLLCILLGLGVAIPFAIGHAGDLSTLVESYHGKFGSAALPWPPRAAWTGGAGWGLQTWQWVDAALLLILGGVPWQVYFQRVLACRNDRVAVRLSLLAACGCLLLAIPPTLLGAVGATVDWNSAARVAPPEGPMVLPYVLRYLTPAPVALLGLGAVAAAVMSSVDSSFLSAASMFSWNVYRPLLRPSAGDAELRRATRSAVVVVGAASSTLALAVQSIYALWYLCADLVYVILFPQLVMVLFARRVTRSGAVAGMTVGLLLRVGGGEPILRLPAMIPYPWPAADGGTYFPFRTFAMLAGLGTIWIVSRFTNDLAPVTRKA